MVCVDSTNVFKTSSPVGTVLSITTYNPRIAEIVSMLSLGFRPNSTWRGSQGLLDSFSEKQKVYLAGSASVALSISPGMSPPMFRITNRIARPITALDRCPGPKQNQSGGCQI